MRARVTPAEVFFDRRRFVKALGLGLAAFATGSDPISGSGRTVTPEKTAASYNHFSEFLPGRGGPVWKYVDRFETEPWQVLVDGECHNPRTFDLDELRSFEMVERVYHFRCVERWAMNVPWTGFPLRKLLARVEPRSSARYVRFVSALRPDEMPGVKDAPYLPWPYREGLRMDEAMHELTFLATGVYGAPLPRQHGAPLRLVVPWKYGFKSPKSIVRIELTRDEPETFWQMKPHEYGFLANVNGNIPHPRWSQELSYWLDSGETFPTPLFNGYESDVGSLYPDEPRSRTRALRPGEMAR
jgi:sulfoxide reductase catalytic subunit YedY